jgi:hypothetical protein
VAVEWLKVYSIVSLELFVVHEYDNQERRAVDKMLTSDVKSNDNLECIDFT